MAFEATYRAALGVTGPANLIVSHDERSGKVLFDYVVRFAQAFTDLGIGRAVRNTASEVHFANGHFVIVIPGGRPSAMRGYKGNVYLDEFAHHRDQRGNLQAAVPVTTRSGGVIRMTSSPLADTDLFWEIFENREGRYGDYFRHITTVHEAIRCGIQDDLGNPLTVAGLLSKLGDPELFACEYECKPIAGGGTLFPRDVLDAATDRHHLDKGSRFGGFDIARSKIGDFTALAECMRHGDKFEVTEVLLAERGVAYDSQIAFAAEQFRGRGWTTMTVDSTGIGDMPTETLQKMLGGPGRVNSFKFSNQTKMDLLLNVRQLMDEGHLSIPNDRELWLDFYSIKREVTPAGLIRYTAEHTERGHADRAIAASLAVWSASHQIQVANFGFAAVDTGGGGGYEGF